MAFKPYLVKFFIFCFAPMAKHFISPEAIEIVSRNVRKYRTDKGVSMETLADLIGIEYTVIARLETKKSNPSISVVYAIAKALDISPSLLLSDIA
ncbi:helix-turn-helix domain-containing protein [Mucilaginibacter psychrotolerans]|nr:helix-turn-helix transcriptional regulator [Mucilaginibacter psychrotolerans]